MMQPLRVIQRGICTLKQNPLTGDWLVFVKGKTGAPFLASNLLAAKQIADEETRHVSNSILQGRGEQ